MSAPEMGPEPLTNPRDAIERLRAQARKAARANSLNLGLVVAVCVALGGFSSWLLSETRAMAQTQTDAVRGRVAALEGGLEAHALDSGQVHRQIKEDLHEVQVDIRALSRQLATGHQPERLRRMPDGGQ